MEYINNKERLKRFKISKDFFAIIDFDRTLTTGASDASMGIIPTFLGGECLKERVELYQYYRPLELDYKIGKEDKIFSVRKNNRGLFTKCKLTFKKRSKRIFAKFIRKKYSCSYNVSWSWKSN